MTTLEGGKLTVILFLQNGVEREYRDCKSVTEEGGLKISFSYRNIDNHKIYIRSNLPYIVRQES